MIKLQGRRIQVRGVVQGVGFRPFIYQIAKAHGLAGWVCNTSGDVTIEVEGPGDSLDRFLSELRNSPPPRSHIESVSYVAIKPKGYTKFEILSSLVKENGYQLVSPDLATCPQCRAEILDPADRRYQYPFTNCTNCGPRFTIIEDIPYDRSRTTMKRFQMCPACQSEYDDPTDRRFHAQPNACPVCGPRLELADSLGKTVNTGDVIVRAAQFLREGKILAVKGLGGFLLACDASDGGALRSLRERKNRPSKPFAVMLKDLEEVKRYCQVNKQEAEALVSPASPIVLLPMISPFGKRDTLMPFAERIGWRVPCGCRGISESVAPGLKHLGVMLPYTPLHHLLIQETGFPLVMTSGNLSEEPIAKDNAEAVQRLRGIADYFILHNRDIYSRYDDSVVTVEQDAVRMVRRARGYAPHPVKLPFKSKPVLACGGELKNTFCLTRDDHAFVSQHIGDMENEETLRHFENTIRLYEKLFRIQPEILVCDLHPDYLVSRWAGAEAQKRDLPLICVQHHHAHIASCMAENGVQSPVIGVALDGTGYGTDGNVWGGEFMVADYRDFQRKAHFEYLPLPGGNAAIRKPYRAAIGYLYKLFGAGALSLDLPCLKGVDDLEISLIKQQVDRKLNTPLTSSCGRLFDVVSSLLGIRQEVEYEGQAAIELEVAAAQNMIDSIYPFNIEVENGMRIIRVKEMLSAVLDNLQQRATAANISASFHNTMAQVIISLCRDIGMETGIRQVALSGGVFQNRRLLNRVAEGLEAEGLVVLLHRQVPCNDGAISLGQAVIANYFGK
jgi:hydrogenase maturation protein HypF